MPRADKFLKDVPGGLSIQDADKALAVTRQFLADLHPGIPVKRPVTLESALVEELGLDSLSRAELAVRIERELGQTLPEQALGNAETVGDLLIALQTAAGKSAPAAPKMTTTGREGAVVTAPSHAASLVEALQWHVDSHPERVQIIYLSDSGEISISYGDLHRQSAAVAAGLQREGLAARQTVAIMLPTGPEYFYTYLGILKAGGIPVPIYPPARLSQIEEHVRRHAGILTNAETTMLVTVPEARGVARLLEARVAGLRRIVTVAQLCQDERPLQPHAIAAEDIAFLQYTSGSTGDPKGVVLTHANLLANIRAIGQAIDVRPDDVFVSWLPLYHDMGLISAWLASLYFATPLVVMSPLAFLGRPERWLQAIDRYRGTLSAAPNFAYDLCVKRIGDAQVAGLNLGSWRLAANGAEPVLPETLERFIGRFARYGFRPEAMTPVYGLAECTVGLLCPPLDRGPRIDSVDRELFSRSGQAAPLPPAAGGALRFVSCGRPLPGHEVRIVDALGNELSDRREGRLEFRGPSATAGYYRNPEQTRRLANGGWLDSGDRAYTADGEVYLTGRVKDIIIRGGRNIYPHEIEDAAGNVAGVRRGCVAVFGCRSQDSGTERLVVLAEGREDGDSAQQALRTRIVEATVAVLGEPPDEVVLVPPHTVLKTSSGKIRRAACRELYEAGQLGTRVRAGWWQVVRLLAGSAALRMLHMARAGADVLYGAYAWSVFILLAGPTWLLTVMAPRPTIAWRVNRVAAKLLLKLAGIRLTVNGRQHLLPTPCVVVANHASFIDGLILLAVLRDYSSFVAKRELAEQAMSGAFLRALGVQFVERSDARRSIEDSRQLTELVKAGTPLAFFPEGGFSRTTGLGAFRLGAFAAAAEAGVPVQPLAISGTRMVMRDGQWLPRRGPVTVTIGKPIPPPDSRLGAFAAAIRLRDAAREQILAHCGERDAQAG